VPVKQQLGQNRDALLAPTNVTTGKAAMTPADANLGWQYFMNHE